MRYEFTKMQSLGNDFIVLDGVTRAVNLGAAAVKRLADRRLGVGCDQVLVAQPPRDATADFVFRVFNQDGGEVAQCGNGARCLAKFLRDTGLTDKKIIRVQTQTRILELRAQADNSIRVDMGIPEFTPAKIPFDARNAAMKSSVDFPGADIFYDLRLSARAATDYARATDGRSMQIAALGIGNPHAVLRVPAVDTAAVQKIGAALNRHPSFPQQVNVSFMQVISRNKIRLRVYERGVGETPGCGSGACAAAVAGMRRGWLADRVAVQLPGGAVEVQWSGGDSAVLLTGPAHTVFHGAIDL